MIFLTIIFLACGKGSYSPLSTQNTQPTNGISDRKVLASNVILKTSSSLTLVSSAQAEEIDTTTKVYAENVVLDNSSTSLVATNIQEAFEEIKPDLETSIIGTWEILIYDPDTCESSVGSGDIDSLPCVFGTITFDSDGLYQSNMSYSYNLLAPPPLSSFNQDLSPTLAINYEKYKVFENSILVVDYSADATFLVDGTPISQPQVNKQSFVISSFTESKIVTSSFVLKKTE